MTTGKELIIDIRPYKKELVTSALEAGIRTIIVPKGTTEQVHKLGRIETISEDGDRVLGKDIFEQLITKKEEENKALEYAKKSSVIAYVTDWKIIPLENLISKSSNVYVGCRVQDISTMLSVMEQGVKGVIIKPKNRAEIMAAVKEFSKSAGTVDLVEATVTEVKVLGSGERTCIDTCNLMSVGEGMLVGNSPKMLFLIQSESNEAEYCATRPFRVNAGAVHSYILLPEGKTKYAMELKSGDEALSINYKGEAKNIIIGRNKIETRPLLLVEAEINGNKSGVVLQNAETIRLIQKDGKHISVADLKVGDKVLVKVGEAGMHFGTKIKETIRE
ncbi:MAG: 3-dehydroquinate synthase II [archaeon]|jgi:3-dehydroquinate synthase II